MTEETQKTDLTNYWQILSRRKLAFLLPFLAIGIGGAALAFLLPPTFRSEATILIERQSIPTDVVATTVTGYVQEQIEQIRQRITSYENLKAIAEENGLYPKLMQSAPREAVRKVSESISVAMVNISTTDPDQRGERKATVAFNVSFSSEDPKIAQSVTDKIASRYLEEHKIGRRARAEEVTAFLSEEARTLKTEIDKMELEIAQFKQGKFGVLPEQLEMNTKLYDRTSTEIDQARTRIRQFGDKLDASRAEIALVNPYNDVETISGEKVLSAPERLSALTAEYLQLSSRYSPKHPDVLKLAREIRILADQGGSAARADEMLTQLAIQQEKLRQARQDYGEEHPEVLALDRSVTALQRGLQNAFLSGSNSNSAPTVAPTNPRYVQLQSQISATESNLRAEREHLTSLEEDLTKYQTRLFQTPEVERQLRDMAIERDAARAKYRELTGKLSSAKVAERIEDGGNAERFVLETGAYLPNLPDSPNRIAILVLSLLMASILGLLSASLAEFLDKTIRGSRSVVAALGMPPLAVIPRIPEPQPLGRGARL